MTKQIKLSQLGEYLGKDMLKFAQNVASEMAITAVDNAPSDTGALKDSIRGGVNQDALQYNPSPDDKNGQAAKEFNKVSANGLKLGDQYHLRAAAPYSGFVENGTDKQSPNGFIKRTLESIDAIARRALDRSKTT